MNQLQQTQIIAGAIFLGMVLVAAAIFFSGNSVYFAQELHSNSVEKTVQRSDTSIQRIYGEASAKTTIVEFSDFECPFCSRLHPTLKKIVDESEGAIKWEYRHLPLSIHAAANPAAIASECVGDFAGNDAFWDYSYRLLSNQRGLTTEYLQDEATKLGVDSREFAACIESSEIQERIDRDVQKATALGGSGTPFSVIVYPDGTTKVASGALPYENWVPLLTNI